MASPAVARGRVTYKTAWHMVQKLLRAVESHAFPSQSEPYRDRSALHGLQKLTWSVQSASCAGCSELRHSETGSLVRPASQ